MWKKVIKWVIIIQLGCMSFGALMWFLERKGYKEAKTKEINMAEIDSVDEYVQAKKRSDYEREPASKKSKIPSILRNRVFETEIYDTYTSYSESPSNTNKIEFSFINDTIAVRREEGIHTVQIYKMQAIDTLLTLHGLYEIHFKDPYKVSNNIPATLNFSLYGHSLNDGLIGKTEDGNNYYFLHNTRNRFSAFSYQARIIASHNS